MASKGQDAGNKPVIQEDWRMSLEAKGDRRTKTDGVFA